MAEQVSDVQEEDDGNNECANLSNPTESMKSVEAPDDSNSRSGLPEDSRVQDPEEELAEAERGDDSAENSPVEDNSQQIRALCSSRGRPASVQTEDDSDPVDGDNNEDSVGVEESVEGCDEMDDQKISSAQTVAMDALGDEAPKSTEECDSVEPDSGADGLVDSRTDNADVDNVQDTLDSRPDPSPRYVHNTPAAEDEGSSSAAVAVAAASVMHQNSAMHSGHTVVPLTSSAHHSSVDVDDDDEGDDGDEDDDGDGDGDGEPARNGPSQILNATPKPVDSPIPTSGLGLVMPMAGLASLGGLGAMPPMSGIVGMGIPGMTGMPCMPGMSGVVDSAFLDPSVVHAHSVHQVSAITAAPSAEPANVASAGAGVAGGLGGVNDPPKGKRPPGRPKGAKDSRPRTRRRKAEISAIRNATSAGLPMGMGGMAGMGFPHHPMFNPHHHHPLGAHEMALQGMHGMDMGYGRPGAFPLRGMWGGDGTLGAGDMSGAPGGPGHPLSYKSIADPSGRGLGGPGGDVWSRGHMAHQAAAAQGFGDPMGGMYGGGGGMDPYGFRGGGGGGMYADPSHYDPSGRYAAAAAAAAAQPYGMSSMMSMPSAAGGMGLKQGPPHVTAAGGHGAMGRPHGGYPLIRSNGMDDGADPSQDPQ